MEHLTLGLGQPDADAVQAQSDRMVDARADKLPQIARI